ncbi:MAG: hypothetical protein GYA55_07015 [SAR324 cluster bacterium]|uniref:Glycosyltransferase RgtA/B/C/D-like domain-containing protein n=1 Tax=SAR324 cluster bacterium TaxID=2024889 RepID=A0A7X9FS85_9DELT|nr:hypothetical protein [SAR324 cluster bacterium]
MILDNKNPISKFPKGLQPILRFVGLGNICFLICLVSLILVQLEGFANDPGVGWHLKTGEWIYSHLRVPIVDPFLAYPIQRVWISDQWFSDLLFFILFKLGSWPLLYSTVIVLFASTFLVFLYSALIKESRLFVLSAIATVLAYKIAQVHFILRPVVFGFLMFTLVYLRLRALIWNLKKSSLHEFLSQIKRQGVILMLIFVLWCNLHPSFVFGIVLVSAFSLTTLFELWVKRQKDVLLRYVVISLCLLPIFCTLATLCNPYGKNLHESILNLGMSSYFMSLHEEWKSPSLSEYSGQLFAFIGLVVVSMHILSKNVRRKLNLFEISIFYFFGILSIDAVRVLPFFAIVSTFPLVRGLGVVSRKAPKMLFKRMQGVSRLEKSNYSPQMLAIVLLCLTVLWSFSGRLPLFHGRFGPSEELFPYQAVEFLTSYVGENQEIPVFSNPNWGGFLTFWGKGRLKPIIDDRNTLLGEAFYRKFFKASEGRVDDFKSFLSNLDVEFLLLPSRSRLSKNLQEHPEFQILYGDDKSLVMCWKK